MGQMGQRSQMGQMGQMGQMSHSSQGSIAIASILWRGEYDTVKFFTALKLIIYIHLRRSVL